LEYNAGVHAKSRPSLGQHFLASAGYRRRIVQALPLRADDLVVEIGPGRGAMTGLLAERAARVVAIEVDRGLAESLGETLKGKTGVEIVHADILATDLAAICGRHGRDQCFVFGNLPYYITSPIIHHVFQYASSIRAMAFLVQREVAERITARPGSRFYGYLSVLVSLHAEPRVVLRVPPGAFSPPPKVQSVLVSFSMRRKFREWSPDQGARLLEFVKLCFGHKRKNLLNNLASTYGRDSVAEALSALGVSLTSRAEELGIEQFAEFERRLL
jgi:16S rRNA (adenine1518-N6/adenine1519-N6)-dimethyltransferase